MKRLILCVLILVMPLVAQADNALNPLGRFLAAVEKTPMTARFIERVDNETSQGTITLGQGGRMRWERKTPYEEMIISNGRQAWHVEPDLNQAVRLDQRLVKGWGQVLNARTLEKNYDVLAKGSVVELRRRPNIHSDWPEFDIVLDKQGLPNAIMFGNDNRMDLSGWKPDLGARFDYTPSAGMEVLGNP